LRYKFAKLKRGGFIWVWTSEGGREHIYWRRITSPLHLDYAQKFLCEENAAIDKAVRKSNVKTRFCFSANENLGDKMGPLPILSEKGLLYRRLSVGYDLESKNKKRGWGPNWVELGGLGVCICLSGMYI